MCPPTQDITVTNATLGQVTFIEVKTSVALAKPFFEISLPELIFAQQTGAGYHIYRVSGAGTAEASLAVITDPVQCVSSRQATLALVLGDAN